MDGWRASTAGQVLFSLEYPEHWEEAEDVMGAAAVFIAPDTGESFRPNLNLIVQDARNDRIESIAAAHATELANALVDTHVLDATEASIDGRPASHVLIAHRNGDDELTLEQWIVLVGNREFILSATAPTGDYPELVDVFAEMVGSVSLADG